MLEDALGDVIVSIEAAASPWTAGGPSRAGASRERATGSAAGLPNCEVAFTYPATTMTMAVNVHPQFMHRSDVTRRNLDGECHLALAWRGVGNNRLNVMRNSDAMAWRDKVTLGDTTTSGPALATLGQRLLIGWRGVGNNQLNVMQSEDGAGFSIKVRLGETTLARIGLYVRGTVAYLAWQGVGNNFLNVLLSTDGVNWQAKYTSSETSIGGPVVASAGGGLVWGWTGTDAAHHLNTKLFNLV